MEKTATSSIQHFLSMNRQALSEEGVIYPQATGLDGGSQVGFVAAVQSTPVNSAIRRQVGIADDTDRERYRQALIGSISQEIRDSSEPHTLVVSSEHFHSRLNKLGDIAALKKFLQRWADEFQVVVYFRRQDKAAVSRYSTALKSGNPDPRLFPSLSYKNTASYYHYHAVYSNWASVFGEQQVSVGLFEPSEWKGGSILEDFCERAYLAFNNKKLPKRVNESVNDLGAALLLQLNQQWPKTEKNWNSTRRRIAVQAISKLYSGNCNPATCSEAMAFYALFEDSNNRLKEQAFPGRETPLFSQDFGQYPETLEPVRLERGALRDVLKKLALSADSVDSEGSAVREAGLLSRIRQVFYTVTNPKSKSKVDEPFILYMGLPKTATTSLQDSLFLKNQDIFYLGKSNAYRGKRGCLSDVVFDAMAPLLWKSNPLSWRTRQLVTQFRRIQADGAKKPFVAGFEAFVLLPPGEFEGRLKRLLAVFGSVSIIVTLRNPLTRLRSMYMHAAREAFRNGSHHTIPGGRLIISFDDWLDYDPPLGATDTRFIWEENIQTAVRLLGRSNVGIFLFEDFVTDRLAFMENICRFMNVGLSGAAAIEVPHKASGLTTGEYRFLRQIQDGPRGVFEDWLLKTRRERNQRLRKAAVECGHEQYSFELSEEQKHRIALRIAPTNRWLSETFDLDLGRYDYPL